MVKSNKPTPEKPASTASAQPDITTTGNDVSSTSTATIRDGATTTTVKASYSANMENESATKLSATIASTTTSKNTTTVDTTEITGKIDPKLGTMRFSQKQNITTTEKLADGGKREQGYISNQSSGLADPMSVAKGLRLGGSSNNHDHLQGKYDATYDAQGKMRAYEGHYTSPAGGYRSDEIIHYDDKDKIKDAMRAQFYDAQATFNQQKGTMEKAGDEDFGVTIGKDGAISYRMGQNTSNNTITETVVDVDSSGKVSGYTAETRRDTATNMWVEAKEAQRKILTAKELDTLRQQMQQRGDNIAQRVSGQNMANYTQRKQSYNMVGANEYFRQQTPEIEAAYQEASKTNQEIAGALDDVFKQVTPKEMSEGLVLQKIKDQQR